MSLSGIILGLINIAIVIAILLLGLYMLVALLFGIPSVRVIGHAALAAVA